MPFQSEAQRRFMWMKNPEIAQRWADEYPGQKNLPQHVSQGRNQVANVLAKRKAKPKGGV